MVALARVRIDIGILREGTERLRDSGTRSPKRIEAGEWRGNSGGVGGGRAHQAVQHGDALSHRPKCIEVFGIELVVLQ